MYIHIIVPPQPNIGDGMNVVTHIDPAFLNASFDAYMTIANAPRTQDLSHLNSLPKDDEEKFARYRVIAEIVKYFNRSGKFITHDALEYICKSHGWTVGMALQGYMMVKYGYLIEDERTGELAIGSVQIPES